MNLAPDGGPWAPVLYVAAESAIEPTAVATGRELTVRMQFRPEHTQRILGLGIRLVPKLAEIDATPFLDRKTGGLEAVVPGKLLKLAGKYEVRMDIRFRWDNGVVYNRSPRLGEVTVGDYRPPVYTAAALVGDLAQLRQALAAAQAALARSGRPIPKMALPNAEDVGERAKALVAAGQHEAAMRLVAEAILAARQAAAAPGLALYHGAIRTFLDEGAGGRSQPIMGILTGASKEYTEEDYAKFRELGIGTVAARVPAEVGGLREHGFGSSYSPAPVRFTKGYVGNHPEHRQHRYLITNSVKADGGVLALDPLHGFHADHYDVDPAGDPGRYWRVLDATTGEALPTGAWSYAADKGRVLVPETVAGHEYRVVVLVQGADIPFFSTFGEPMVPACLKHILARLELHLKERQGLTVYRPTSLFYPFPKLDSFIELEDGRQASRGWHNFYGSQWGTSPAIQAQFSRESKIPFDPLWMVDDGRYGDVNYPPRPGHVAWRAFQARQVNRMARDVVEVAHRNGARVRVFWGDHWIGMEPYGGFFPATGADEIVKACKSAVVVRMTVDFPGDAKRIIRFSPWFSAGELFNKADPPAFLEACWGDIKRGALFHMPDGLTWGGSTQNIGFKQPAIYLKMREIADEFRAMHALLAGKRVFTHDLTLYVVNAWGASRSWTGWLQVNDSQRILAHLTDLPVRVRFLSISEIAANGVPEDADVLLNAGEPHSSWSGGFHWTDEAVRAVREFVARGGGLIGVGAPSHLRRDGVVWRLSDVLGMDFEDSMRKGEGDAGAFSTYDSIFLRRGSKPAPELPMRRTGVPHFITEDLPAETAPVLVKVRAKQMADDVQLLCSGDGKSMEPPLVAAHPFQRGRVVYINGYSSGLDYGRLLRRAVFWAARREGDFARLVATDPAARTYLYPSEHLLVAYNCSEREVETRVRLDPSLLAFAGAEVQFVDALAGATQAVSTAACRDQGLAVRLAPHEARFLRVSTPR